MAEALFSALSDDRFQPSELARGPWSPTALHGGPVAALLARSLERAEAPVPMHPARLTVELLRPVPLAPLTVRLEVPRPGRKVQLLDAFLYAGDAEVARARMLRIRAAEIALPGSLEVPIAPSFAGPADAPSALARRDDGALVAYHSHATEHRVVRGVWGEPGPVVDWIRLRQPIVAGEEPSPLQRVAAAADFGNGVSGVLPFPEYAFINPDLTIHLHRLPVGEWVCLDAATLVAPHGVGLAESALWDERGRIGRSVQSLLLERT